jgi:uncharacterized protein involved in exopolysaccharide biosynthesis
MGQIQSLSELLHMLRRRFVVWSSIVVFGIILTLAYTFSLPRLYESVAIVQIGNSQLSDRLAGANGQTSLTQYLLKIEQRIMARDNLIGVIDKYNLFAENSELSMNDKVFQLRLATKISQVIDPSQAWRPEASPSALTISVRLGDPKLGVVITQSFVDSVLKENTLSRINQARKTFAFFESEELRVGKAIAELDAEIAIFKQSYASSLPSALQTQRELLVRMETATLEIDQQIAELNNSKAKLRASDYSALIKSAHDQRLLVTEKRDAISRAIDAAPGVEKEFLTLTRRLQQLENQYDIITRNRAEAEIGQMLETGLQSQSLTVLESPVEPEWPVSPNRKKIAAIGMMLSIIVAAFTTLLLEMVNPVIRNAAQLERQLQIIPVVSIPVVKTTKEHVWRKVWIGVISFAGLIAVWAFTKIVNKATG